MGYVRRPFVRIGAYDDEAGALQTLDKGLCHDLRR